MKEQILYTKLQIISATYGPAEGRKLLNGKLVNYEDKETYVPYTRDVLPFVRALMSLSFDGNNNADCYYSHREEEKKVSMEGDGSCKGSFTSSSIQLQQRNNVMQKKNGRTTIHNTNKNSFPLMDGRPMNAVFGDCCPGTTKLLKVEYRFLDYSYHDDRMKEAEGETNDTCGDVVAADYSNKETVNAERTTHHHQQQHNIVCTSSRVFQSTFREHERVLLKRQDPLFHLETDNDDGVEECLNLNNNGEGDTTTIQNESDGTAAPGTIHTLSQSSSSLSSPSKREVAATPRTNPEITLPIILPYLTVRERARCQLVCTSWKDQVQEQGVAKVIDVNDTELFRKHNIMNQSSTHHQPSSVLVNTSTNDASSSSSSIHNHPSSLLLRGLINQSHSSLESLVLNDFIPLQPSIDLHPALPFLRKLSRVDISRIPSITDQTLHLISTCIGNQLEVLYMKGLRQISNDGIIHLVTNCSNLRVLDISEIHQLDDRAGVAIGRHLNKLEVLHAKDNYKLTNQSVDVITTNCRMLIQITLWGSILLKHVDFDKTTEHSTTDDLFCNNTEDNTSMSRPPSSLSDFHNTTPTKLILLNLWGCHNLLDTAAKRLTSLPHLRSLCVSECHRLTDQFILGITESLPQLVHLQLRYVRRITNVSLEAISQRMQSLYSLDLSFCTRLTMQGICHFLITERCTSLSELRLYSCKQLNVEGGSGGGNNGGRQLVQALKSIRDDDCESTLSFLDVRECQQIEPFGRDTVYVGGMQELGFDEIMLHGLFVRPARWNEKVRRQLVATLSDHSET